MKVSGGLVFFSFLLANIANTLQDKVDANAKAVVVESASKKKVEPKLLSSNPAINSAVVGVGVGVIGSLLVGALLENKNKCNNRYSRDTAAQGRFLPGVFGPKCPPRPSGYNPYNNNNNNGYRQPTGAYHPSPVVGYQPVTTQGYRPVNTQSYQPVTTQGYRPVNTQGYQPATTQGYRPVNTQGYQPVTTQGYRPVNNVQGYHPITNQGYHPINNQGYQVAPGAVYQPAGSIAYHPANVYGQGVQGYNKQVIQQAPPPPGSIGTLAQFGRSNASGTKSAAKTAKTAKSSAVKFSK